MNDIEKVNDNKIISDIVLHGDIGKLKPEEKTQYYNMLCQSLGLNPVTQPFKLITLQGKQTLYASKDCTEQLRKQQGVSVIEQSEKVVNEIYIVNVKLQDSTGRIDTGKGAVNIKGLSGDNLANAMMKAETKAKRRGTLSICGLGMLDETELDTMPKFETQPVIEEPEEDKIKRRQQEAKEKYDTFYNSLEDGYKFELKDMDERERFILFQECKWDIKKLDEKIIEWSNKNTEKSPFKNNDENLPEGFK